MTANTHRHAGDDAVVLCCAVLRRMPVGFCWLVVVSIGHVRGAVPGDRIALPIALWQHCR